MSLVGTYNCAVLNATLSISEANNGNGQASGRFSMGETNVAVSIHYHFEGSNGPKTTLRFNGGTDDPNHYVGGAGDTSNEGYAEINLAGGLAGIGEVGTFSGIFRKA